MHELAIAQNVLDVVLEEGRRHGLAQVTVIRLQVGALAAVVPDALTFCFEMISQQTMAAGARLDIETIPVVVRCPKCHEAFTIDDHMFVCPECGEPAIDLISGRELLVASIEGETGETDDPGEHSSCT
ncbi:MAG TPA: hydrogenase maturation nickel metallochaperone HypA [Syntrophobacteraceae bacterium]|nr:hydrogenase maturation nickel metallochaperone HypA [Syntrophobacteraceae bacterium]